MTGIIQNVHEKQRLQPLNKMLIDNQKIAKTPNQTLWETVLLQLQNRNFRLEPPLNHETITFNSLVRLDGYDVIRIQAKRHLPRHLALRIRCKIDECLPNDSYSCLPQCA